MKVLANSLPKACGTAALLGLTLLGACTDKGSSNLANAPLGSSVVLNEGAIACEQPSNDLDRLASVKESDRKALIEKLSKQESCHDSSKFIRNGSWTVQETLGTQLGVKMKGYIGKYWVSRAEVKSIDANNSASSAVNTAAVQTRGVTIDEWRKALTATYKPSSTKKEEDGITTFFASFEGSGHAFGKYDAFNKVYVFTPLASRLYGEFGLGSNIRCDILVMDGKPAGIILSPSYWSGEGEGLLSLRKVAVLLDGELLFERDFQPTDVMRKPSGVGMMEIANIVLTAAEIGEMRKINKESKIAIRLTGRDAYVNLKKDHGIDPIDSFRSSIIESLAVYDAINKGTAGHMPD
jgi:hypothetical protein